MTAPYEHDDATTGPGRVVVIGTGLAGTRIAHRLGERAMLIGEETHAPYNRVLLAEVLAGTYAPEVIELPRATVPHLRTRAVRIDRERRLVQCENGDEVGYDTLVLATGSNPVLPRCAACSRSKPPNCRAASTRSARWTTAWRCPRPSPMAPAPSSSAAASSVSPRPARSPGAARRWSSPSSPSG